MRLEPLNDNILVRVDLPDKETKGGLLLPDSAHNSPPNTGTVVAVGPGKVSEAGHLVPVGLMVGDRVVFKPYKIETIPDTEDGRKVMMAADNVIAKLVEDK